MVEPYADESIKKSFSDGSLSTGQSDGCFVYPTEKGCETVPHFEAPINPKDVDGMHKFWNDFRDRFTSGLPIIPPFLLTRFSTALERCLEPNSTEVSFSRIECYLF